MAAYLTNEMRLEIGQANVVRPLIGADRDGMRAFVVGTSDKQAPKRQRPDITMSDFLLPLYRAQFCQESDPPWGGGVPQGYGQRGSNGAPDHFFSLNQARKSSNITMPMR